MRIFLTSILILLNTVVVPQCLQMDVMILADFSGSVRGKECHVLDAAEGFVDNFNVSENTRVGFLIYSNAVSVILPLTSSKENAMGGINKSRRLSAGGDTHTAEALYESAAMLYQDKFHHRKVIIHISDGDPTNGTANYREHTLLVAQGIKSTGIQICSVYISEGNGRIIQNAYGMTFVKDAELEISFMKESSSNCYTETDYEGLARVLKKLGECM